MGMVSGVLVLMGFAKLGFFMICGPFFLTVFFTVFWPNPLDLPRKALLMDVPGKRYPPGKNPITPLTGSG